jgi:hypothetical protein
MHRVKATRSKHFIFLTAATLLTGCDPRPEVVDTTLPEEAAPAGDHTPRSKAALNIAGSSSLAADESTPKFSCVGAYSDVNFSEESGDGSGILGIIGKVGPSRITIWEGGPSEALPVVTSSSASKLQLSLRFPDYPEQKSRATLGCRGGKLHFQSADMGYNTTLASITKKELAELTSN